MSTWRRKALEIMPKQRQLIEAAESSTALWIELYFLFQAGVEANDEELQKNVLTYAGWCTSPEAGDAASETQQAVYCGFLEDIARNKKNFPHFKKWFSQSQFSRYQGSFKYVLKDKEFEELEAIFNAKKNVR